MSVGIEVGWSAHRPGHVGVVRRKGRHSSLGLRRHCPSWQHLKRIGNGGRPAPVRLQRRAADARCGVLPSERRVLVLQNGPKGLPPRREVVLEGPVVVAEPDWEQHRRAQGDEGALDGAAGGVEVLVLAVPQAEDARVHPWRKRGKKEEERTVGRPAVGLAAGGSQRARLWPYRHSATGQIGILL